MTKLAREVTSFLHLLLKFTNKLELVFSGTVGYIFSAAAGCIFLVATYHHHVE